MSRVDPVKTAISRITIFAKQYCRSLQISFRLVLYDVLYHDCHVFGWKLCSKFYFFAFFLILVNFTAFRDDAKKNAAVSNNDGLFLVNL